MQEMIISALIGLNGAENNHGAMEGPDRLILDGLAICMDPLDVEKAEKLVRDIRRAKATVAPDCSACLNRCGNTDDFDMEQFYNSPKEIQDMKLLMLTEASNAAKRILEKNKTYVPRELHTALAYFKFDYPLDYYEKLIAELKEISYI